MLFNGTQESALSIAKKPILLHFAQSSLDL